MKKQLFTLLVTASFLSGVKPALADTQPTSDNELQKVAAQTAALESEVDALKKEIHQLKVQQKHSKKTTKQKPPVTYTVVKAPATPGVTNACAVKSPVYSLTGTPVVIAPYVGDHVAFNALDLIVNYSSYNEDLRLLQLRQQMFQQYQQQNIPAPDAPMLMLSGKVEAQAAYQNTYSGTHTSSLNLSSAELDLIPTIGEWASGFIALGYDDAATLNNLSAVQNSRVQVKKAFLTFGNLNQFPLYATIGQFNVPFGAYASNMISDTIPQDIFQTRARALLLGYEGKSGQGPYAEIFAFNGDTNTNQNNNINNVGANVGFNFTRGTFSGDLGVSGIANVADSLSMQNTGSPAFQGFAIPTVANQTPEFLHRQVPGAALHGSVGLGNFSLLAEYIGATSPFDQQDMTFNNHGAEPRAMNVEAAYSFPVFGGKPGAISAGYGRSWDAVALGVPESRYIASFTTSLWRDTIEEIEFRHDINYNSSDVASAQSVNIPADLFGGSANSVLLQLGVYF
jgi:hypothetical protein